MQYRADSTELARNRAVSPLIPRRRCAGFHYVPGAARNLAPHAEVVPPADKGDQHLSLENGELIEDQPRGASTRTTTSRRLRGSEDESFPRRNRHGHFHAPH